MYLNQSTILDALWAKLISNYYDFVVLFYALVS